MCVCDCCVVVSADQKSLVSGLIQHKGEHVLCRQLSFPPIRARGNLEEDVAQAVDDRTLLGCVHSAVKASVHHETTQTKEANKDQNSE